MAYLKNFRWDVFLSYAHVDNDKTETQPRHWVTTFRDELYDALKKLSGDREVAIFWDTDLRANQQFTTAIEAAIGGSAVLVALTSPTYLRSSYCQREVEAFCRKASGDPYGLVLDAISYETRLFNVRLYDLPRPEWLPPLRDLNEYRYFAAGSDSPAMPVSTGRIRGQIPKLADAIIKTLKKMDSKQPEVDSLKPPDGVRFRDAFSVYVARVQGNLAWRQEEVLEMLEAKGIDILGPAQKEALASQLISKAQVSVHLLNGFSDSDVERQLELGKAAPQQIIWLSRGVDLEKSDLSSFEQNLLALATNSRGDRDYELMRGENVAVDVVEAILRLKVQWQEEIRAQEVTPDLFIDVRDSDRGHAAQLFDYLSSQKIPSTIIQRYVDQPTDEAFVEHVRRAKAIVFFYGNINKATLEGRLNYLTEVVRLRKRKLDMIGVFAAPPPVKRLKDIQPVMPLKITWMNNTRGFDPATLGELLNLFRRAPEVRP